MKKRNLSSLVMVTAMTALLSLSGGLSFAANGDKAKANPKSDKVKAEHSGPKAQGPAKAASPHLEAKREMVRKQQEQRITQEQRKIGAKNLQAQRKKVYDAKQAVKNAPPQTIDNK